MEGVQKSYNGKVPIFSYYVYNFREHGSIKLSRMSVSGSVPAQDGLEIYSRSNIFRNCIVEKRNRLLIAGRRLDWTIGVLIFLKHEICSHVV